MTTCPKCHVAGLKQEMEAHHSTYHLHCPQHGWLAKSDVKGYWDAMEKFKSRGCEPSGAAAPQVVNPS